MKNVMILVKGGVIVLLLSLSGCRDPKVPDTAVNPAFELNPPVAESVSIQLIEKNKEGNLLVVADFGKQLGKNQYHAIDLSTGKVTLRDDGKGGDKEAGDGKFSVVMKENIDSLTTQLRIIRTQIDNILKTGGFEFVGRHKVKRRDLKELENFNPENIKLGRDIFLPRPVLCFLPSSVSIPHSLMVTNVNTVEDAARTVHPCTLAGTAHGAWTFQKLMTDMANTPSTGVPAEEFVKDWLSTWLTDATVNGELIAARTQMFNNVIRPWVATSNGVPIATVTTANWKTMSLNLSRAPFKLIAIVNRLDLHGNVGYGMSEAGEGRFVFEVLNPTCAPLSGQFTVIFEYGIPIHKCASLRSYASEWYNLKSHPVGSAAFNDALQDVTDVFATANAAPSRPNGSSLNQIRTNERAIGAPWELREFNIDSATHKLALTTVKQEPAEKYNGSSPITSAPDVAKLVTWINDNEADILLNKHVVTPNLTDSTGTFPFLGGRAHSEPGLWTGTGITNPEARHHFSFNTCSGCHQQETSTGFVHLSVEPFGTESTPSGFLSGTSVLDPDGSGITHSFGDLEDRQEKLVDLMCTSCRGNFLELVSILRFRTNTMEH